MAYKNFLVLYIIFLSALFSNSVHAQNAIIPEKAFDFWLGNWEVSWEHADSTKGHGVNSVKKILDKTVIQENFKIIEGNWAGFKGKSLSVFSPAEKTWKQNWFDNQGGYYSFTSEITDKERIFQTKPEIKGDSIIIFRMVFYDIKDNSFTWDWESSVDGGQNWKLNWRIFYNRLDEDDPLQGITAIYNTEILGNRERSNEVHGFERLIGTWDCTFQTRKDDNSWDVNRAIWVWEYILGGNAVQDHWFGPETFGSNIRLYNRQEEKWLNTWVEDLNYTMNGVWEASSDSDDKLIMTDNSRNWKIIFFNIKDESFEWKWDFKQPNGEMKTMLKIYAKRIN